MSPFLTPAEEIVINLVFEWLGESRGWREHRSPQTLLTHEKPAICGPICLKMIIFSKRRIGWLATQC
jgi:hypothetical protein